jgi:hypothetical protein
MPKKKNDLLSSWKEIAAYLDCDVRTAHRWEKEYGLPVHRLGKGSRARVFAYEHELEAWLRRKSENDYQDTKPSFIKTAMMAAATVLILGLIGVFVYQLFIFDHTPHDFRIEQTELIILNREGHELWRHNFQLDTNLNNEFYRLRFQNRTVKDLLAYLPAIQIRDINDDGKKEVLFSIAEIADNRFFCFSHNGKELWRVKSGKELTFGSKVYADNFNIDRFRTIDFNGDGLFEVFLLASHNHEFPTQMLQVDHEGKILAEYWHSGRIIDMVPADINMDGHKDLIIAGVNNQFDSPFIAVFDVDDISGCSPNTGEYSCAALEPGSEKYYIRLPFTETAQMSIPLENMGHIRQLTNNVFAFQTRPVNLEYRFDRQFRLLEIRDSHDFEMLFQEAQAQGRIGDISRREYVDSLKDRIRWYNGEKWVPEPAMRNEW